MLKTGTLLMALALSSSAEAATIFKCVDAAGKVTFTKNQNCPRNSGLDDIVRAHNPAPRGSSAPVQMATPRSAQVAGQAQAPAVSQPRTVAVVGGSAPSVKCDTGLSDRDLRTAKVRGEVVPGMSRKDVETIHGKPIDGTNARGGGANTYWNDKYVEVTSVNFDGAGCVRSTYQSGHRP